MVTTTNCHSYELDVLVHGSTYGRYHACEINMRTVRDRGSQRGTPRKNQSQGRITTNV